MPAESFLVDLSPRRVPLADIFLDPNNPRLLGTDAQPDASSVPDDLVTDDAIQKQLEARLRDIGIDDLVNKIRQAGFVVIDRIVVRPLTSDTNQFVVLEGNRRIAAVRAIRSSPAILGTMTDKARASLEEADVLIYEGHDPDATWEIQGLRHIESIKEWGPYQQGRFLVEMQDRKNARLSDVAEQAGVSARRAGQLTRSYRGFTQAQQDDEWGGSLRRNDFSIFLEAIFHRKNSPLWEWLDWDETSQSFGNTDRLGLLLSLFKEKDDETGEARIQRVNPDLRDNFTKLLRTDHSDLLEEFLNRERTLDKAVDVAVRRNQHEELSKDIHDIDRQRDAIKDLAERIEVLPMPKIALSGRAGDFAELLATLQQVIEYQQMSLAAMSAE